jgi:hypothetical protein
VQRVLPRLLSTYRGSGGKDSGDNVERKVERDGDGGEHAESKGVGIRKEVGIEAEMSSVAELRGGRGTSADEEEGDVSEGDMRRYSLGKVWQLPAKGYE